MKRFRYREEDNVTLAFFGLDKNEDRTETMGSFRTDSIMVIRFDFARGEVDMVSIPRDTYCKINNRDFYDILIKPQTLSGLKGSATDRDHVGGLGPKQRHMIDRLK